MLLVEGGAIVKVLSGQGQSGLFLDNFSPTALFLLSNLLSLHAAVE